MAIPAPGSSAPPPAALDLNAMPLPALHDHLAATGWIDRLLALALDEDLGGADRRGPGSPLAEAAWRGIDVTTEACICHGMRARAVLASREPGVVAGLRVVPSLLRLAQTDADLTILRADGDAVRAGEMLAELSGSLGDILVVERTLLNLVSRLSGIATRTAAFVGAIPPGSRARVYDTRKTTPGMRVLEKYAVRCGGGLSHRLGLWDAVLIKDNHIANVATERLGAVVTEAAQRARRMAPAPLAFIEVEVETPAQFEAMLALPRGIIDIILLDNMTIDQLRAAVARRDAAAPWLQLEASGGITLETIAAVAGTGVERISAGALTHSAPALDVGLDVTS